MKALLAARLRALGQSAPISFCIRFADGSELRNRVHAPEFTLHFRTIAAQWRTVLFGHIGLLEAYFTGAVEFEGDLARVFALGLAASLSAPNPLVSLRNHWHELRRNNKSWQRARDNARFHYGLGADFYSLWLDQPLLMYTCGYWPEGTHSVDEAQRHKVEHVCRKVMLAPGETVVDIGCGFGGFMFHAAERYGVSVTGINITTEQVDWLRSEIGRRGLSDRLSVRDTDFRDVDRQYDKVVSIGVLEHAGRDQVDEVVRAHADFLKPGGLGMLHFIGHVARCSPAAGFQVLPRLSLRWIAADSRSSTSRTCAGTTS